MVPATITGPSALGRMWRTTWRDLEAPSARAASTNSFSREGQELGAYQARGRHPAQAADHHHDQGEHAALGPECRLERIAEQVDQHQQQRQLRQGEE